jgi:signal transduction histidine kinase/ActR/RegA family two-component response regulator
MLNWLIYGMVFCGAGLMVYNIYGFIRFAGYVQKQKAFENRNSILRIPIVLLVFFLLGYLAVGIFGKPDLIISGILFFGSVFVFIMYILLNSITQRILENGRLEAELMAAEEAKRAKNDFLASVSHEMRTPMNVILGLDDIALREPDLPDRTREQLEKIGLSARHLLGLINNILDLNRMESGDTGPQKREFYLADTLAQVSAIIQTLCDEKGLTYETDLAGAEEGIFVGDDMLLKEILLSILDNAVKYTDAPGRVRFALETAKREEDARTLRFTVSDTGIGMDEEFIAKVFDAFSREDASSTTRFSGTGVSMAVTRKNVELLGGTITLESKKGVGTTFYVTLPFGWHGSAPKPEAEAEVSLEGRRVLLAEDLPENAMIVEDLLELEGVETDHALNGQLALDKFLEHPPGWYDAVLMDLRMPVMDGLEAARRIRASGREDAESIPIIALTANAYDSDRQQSLAAGMNEHLAKPADADMMYATLRRFMHSKPAEEEGP